ncbi:MAG: hypothetical protein U0703_06840 [Anaerolineae bacterium]
MPAPLTTANRVALEAEASGWVRFVEPEAKAYAVVMGNDLTRFHG